MMRMRSVVIKNNITRLLKERDWTISDLEKKLGLNRSVSNILRGTSKNPTIELLTSVAKAFNIEINDLLEEPVKNTGTDTKLLLETCAVVINQIDSMSVSKNLSYNIVISIIKKVYEYSIQLDLKTIDKNFVQWTISSYTKGTELK
jgi:transcriptional regulator with XRE-family HTH domain